MIQRTLKIAFVILMGMSAAASAEEKPSWPVIDAANRLIGERALFQPGRDGFVKWPSGRLVQYQLPSKNYRKEGSSWKVELMSVRYRFEEGKGWSEWLDARPKYSAWRIGVIRVDILASGVKATWEEDKNFVGCKPPNDSEVTHRIPPQGTAVKMTPADSAGR